MSNATETLERWYCLADFRKIDWNSWKSQRDHQRQKDLEEMMEIGKQWTKNSLIIYYSYDSFKI